MNSRAGFLRHTCPTCGVVDARYGAQPDDLCRKCLTAERDQLKAEVERLRVRRDLWHRVARKHYDSVPGLEMSITDYQVKLKGYRDQAEQWRTVVEAAAKWIEGTGDCVVCGNLYEGEHYELGEPLCDHDDDCPMRGVSL